MRKMIRISLLFLTFVLPLKSLSAEDSCFYINESGVFKTVDSIEKVPQEKRKLAKCSKVKKKKETNSVSSVPAKSKSNLSTVIQNLLNKQQGQTADTKNTKDNLSVERFKKIPKNLRPVRPEDVELSKARRTVDMSTSLGRVKLSWDRSAEKYFGKSPERAVQKAMTAASRVLSQNSFPDKLKKNKYDWQVVIMDKVPSNVMINMQGRCHPAWMRPPADIFISAKDIATSCSQKRASLKNASEALQETLIHEIGHAIEFQFLGQGFALRERWHNEGFATWFESLGANYISGSGVNRSKVRDRARKAWSPRWSPEMFQGTGEDYARAYAMIATLAEKKSILRLSDIYSYMSEKRVNLLKAIDQEGGWSRKKLMEKTADNLGIVDP